MAFRTLFDAGYAAYLEENGDNVADLWFFLHIPKTAGSSFRAEIADLLVPNANVHAYDGSSDDFATRRSRAIQSFADAATTFRFASGHVPNMLMAPIIEAGRRPKILTMLRDPVARVISDFRYQSSPQHPDWAAFRERCPTIDEYLAVEGERDKMMGFLAPSAEATVADTVNHVLDQFTFVGAMETYRESFAMMMDILDVDRAPSTFLRKTVAEQAPSVAITAELDARIRSLNARDVALYDTLMGYVRRGERLRAKAPAWHRVAPKKGFSAWRDV